MTRRLLMAWLLLGLLGCRQTPLSRDAGAPASSTHDLPGGMVRDPVFNTAPPLGVRPGYAADR